jgi:quinol monooxygenase YgiN
MSDATVRVHASFAVRADQVDAFLEEARRSLVEPTQREPGCLEYDLWQDAADPTRFAMVEAWESAEHLAAHLAQPSLQAAVAKLAPMAAEPPSVQRLRRPGR